MGEPALNLPNALTLLRIFLVPVLVVVLLTRAEGGLFLGAGIFGLGVLTDYLDGYFARRRNQVTKLGILLDPLADKLLTAAAFLSLVEMGLVPAWMVMIILGRELAKALDELEGTPEAELRRARRAKFRAMGVFA